MKKQFIDTGEIVAVHGVHGEVRIHPWSDSGEFLCGFQRFYTDKNGQNILEVESARPHKNMVVAKLKGCDSVEQAQKLRGRVLYINRDDCALEAGDFFIQDLIGMAVRDVDSGEEYGILSDVSQTGANDVYHISAEGKALKLIPAIKDVVISTDLEANLMLIRPLEGLFDAN